MNPETQRTLLFYLGYIMGALPLLALIIILERTKR